MNLETTFDLLRHPRRRAVVRILDETDSISRRRLAARIAAEAELGPQNAETGTGRDARELRIALHHNHLPRLADAGVVEYDDETVTATPKLEAVVEYATLADEGPANSRRLLGARLSHFYA